jgi:ligand-binding sensor domain-containing protein/two-component sensor histidine kinase
MKIKKKYILLLYGVFGWCLLQSQPYTFLNYSLAEGLPQSQVWCGLSDSRGLLWFGTQGGGLCHFDGEAFESYTTAAGLPSNFILSLFQEKEYRIWVGTNRGLCAYDGQVFTTVEALQHPIYSIEKHPNGSLLAGTHQGVYQLLVDSMQATPLSLHPDLDVSTIYKLISSEDRVWAGTSKGLWQLYPECQQLSTHEVYDLTLSGDTLIAAIYGKGIYQYVDKLQPLHNDQSLSYPRAILKSPSNELLIATTDKGLFSYEPSTGLTKMNINTPNNIRDLLYDQSGRLWVTSSGEGVACLNRQNFIHFSKADGLRGNRIYAIHSDTAGQLWLAVSRKGLQIIDSLGIRTPVNQPFQDVKCKTICHDSLGQIWVGSEGSGIAVLDTAGWFPMTEANGLPSNWILKLITDEEGIIWGATYNNGLFSIERGSHRDYTIRRYGVNSGLPDLRINALSLDQQGSVWFGTRSGHIGRIQPKGVNLILAAEQGLPKVAIRSLAFDQFDQIWAGTKGEGVYFARLKGHDSQFTQLSSIQPTASENIYLILTDHQHQIWAGSESGVDKIQLDSIGQVIEVLNYNRNDGFLGIETCHDAALAMPNGEIWFGTMNGLTHYLPGESSLQCNPPSLHFTSIDLFYKPLRETQWAAFAMDQGGIKEGLELPFKKNHLSFHFQAISQLRPQEIRYRWKLDGIDEDWSPAAEASSVNYANLPPGTYQFMVQAAIVDCPWSEPLHAPFAIAEPFWQASWFLPAAVLLAVLLISWIAWSSVRRIKKREKIQREQLEVQNRMLQLEQKALQLQMNPHFIFNALTGIQSLVAQGDYSKARKRINEFAKLMRSTLYNARKSTISLQEEIDALNQYLEIEQFCQRQPFTFDLQLPEDLDPEAIELPPMLLQPFLENAVVHGVSHLPYAGHIEVFFELKEELLYVRIRDNGVGRKKAAKLREERKPGHQSVAMTVNKERLEALRADRSYTPLSISDLVDEQGKIMGTMVELVVPVRFVY